MLKDLNWANLIQQKLEFQLILCLHSVLQRKGTNILEQEFFRFGTTFSFWLALSFIPKELAQKHVKSAKNDPI